MKRKVPKADTHAFALSVGRALWRAVKTARKIARANHTPLYVWRDGKVVAKRP